MCGIVGIVGNTPVAPLIVDALKRLEYRGYDSAGVATLEYGHLDRRRAEGKLRNLEAKLSDNPLSGVIGIGHTRWATHGKPNETNAHPHATDKLAVVHNVWPAWYAVGIAERRREQWAHARRAFETALELSPGCTPAHIELVAVCVSLDDSDAAVSHAERAIALEGETPRSLAVLATALLAAQRHEEAQAAIDRSLSLDETDEAHRALAERIRAGPAPATGPLARLRDTLSRWLKR